MKKLEEIVDCLMTSIEEVTLGNMKKSEMTEATLLMDEAGLDSLDYASVMLSGEEFVGTKLDENKIKWSDIKTIRDLAELLFNSQ